MEYEEERSLIQDLTFIDAVDEFKRHNSELGESQMKTLGIINSDNIFTNLGLLLSDQCVHTIKAAVFSGPDKGEFNDRREFAGSILKQLAGVYEYINIYNKNKSEFYGLERKDKRDYPEEAIREALLNLIVHRDYSYSGSGLINIYNNKIEFVSIGGLVKGLTINDIKTGISQARNEKIAAMFYRLKLIEAYGTGIIKIFESYKNSILKPELRVTENTFVISLPNLNLQYLKSIEVVKEDIIIDYLGANTSLTRKEAESLLNVGQTATGKVLSGMLKQKKIRSIGLGRNTRYAILNK